MLRKNFFLYKIKPQITTRQHHLNYQLQWQPFCCYSGKNSHLIKQSKILGKLYGERIAGTKRKWFPSNDSKTGIVKESIQFGPKQKYQSGKPALRRMQVLNKLFMEHITDLLATGEISQQLIGQGLHVTRLKISPDFCFITVFWLTTGDVERDNFLDIELQRCSGLLRHELSQLNLMGEVPRIRFAKDKLHNNMAEVEAILKTITFTESESKQDDTTEDEDSTVYVREENLNAEYIKQEFFGISTELKSNAYIDNRNNLEGEDDESKHVGSDLNVNSNSLNGMLPSMRHDVFGLDHKAITLKILTKMRKSKKAWEQYDQKENESYGNLPINTDDTSITKRDIPATSKVENAKLKIFLAKRQKEHEDLEWNKEFSNLLNSDLVIPSNDDSVDDSTGISAKWKRIYESEDYIVEDENEEDNKK